MLSINSFSDYARSRPELAGEQWRTRLLGGGVSNTVLLAESVERRLVFKQSLGQLRVEEEWLADRSRAMADLRTTLANSTSTNEAIQSKLAGLRSVRERARTDLAAAQKDLKSILTARQEGVLVTFGLLD